MSDGETHPRPDRILVVGGTVIEIWNGNCCRTTLPDGKQVIAAPEDTPEYRQRAYDLGYGADVHRMSFDHEVGHTLMATLVGLPCSPTMAGVATGAAPTWLTDHEEAAVMAFQLYCNTAGVDLLDVAERVGSRVRLP